MSAYKGDLHIKSDERGLRLALAQELLATRQGVVVLDSLLALRPFDGGIICEVIARRSKDDFASQAALAQDLLVNSTLRLPPTARNLHWIVVDDYGTGTQELWRAS